MKVLSEASPSHLALASFIVFPIVLDYWLQAILKLFPNLADGWRIIALIVLIAIYIVCLIWLAKESSLKNTMEVKRNLVPGRLSSNNWTEMGLDSAKKVLEENTSDEDIHKVIQGFPKTLRFVRLRVRDKDSNIQNDEQGKTKYKSGIGRVRTENT